VFDIWAFDIHVFDIWAFDIHVFDIRVFDIWAFDIHVFDIRVFDIWVRTVLPVMFVFFKCHVGIGPIEKSG